MPFPPTVAHLVALLNFNNWNLNGSYLVVTPPHNDAQMIFGADRNEAVIRVVNGPDAGPTPGLPAPHGGPNYTLYSINFAHLPAALLAPAHQQVLAVPVTNPASLTVTTTGENALVPPQVVNVMGALI